MIVKALMVGVMVSRGHGKGRGRGNGGRESAINDEEKACDKSKVRCYNCDKLGHYTYIIVIKIRRRRPMLLMLKESSALLVTIVDIFLQRVKK